MIDLRDIYSLSDFQRKTREHIRRLHQTGRPEVLTVNGRAELVVQGAAAYQQALAGRPTPASLAIDRPVLGDAELESDPVIEAYKLGVDRTLLRENLRRSVQERLAGLSQLQQLATEAARAGRRSRSSA